MFSKTYLKTYFFIDKSSENGSAPDRSSWLFRSSPFWKYFAEYFPIVLHKTHELDPAFHIIEGEKENLDNDDNDLSKDKQVNGTNKTEALNGNQKANGTADDNSTQATTSQFKKPNKKKLHKRKTKGKKGSSKHKYHHHHRASEAEKSSNSEETITSPTTENSNAKDSGKHQEKVKIIKSSTIYERPIEEKGFFGFRTFFQNIGSWIWGIFTTKNPVKYGERTGKQYIFGYHPHGIIGMGAVGGVATEGEYFA